VWSVWEQIIKQVATIARSTPIQQQVYWILLMITDGVISDMERTISEIVDASDLPFSISTSPLLRLGHSLFIYLFICANWV
jgi:hypothetical protein